MKLIRCVGAYRALNELSKMEWSYAEARRILQLMNCVEPEVRFFAGEELELVKKVTGKLPDSDGTFKVSGEDLALLQHKRLELEQVEVLEGFIPIRLTPPERMRPETLAELEGFVVFEEGSA